MNPNNTSSSVWRQWALRYGLAFVAVATGFGLRMALTAWIGPGLPTYITFYPAVMVAALLAGFGPGLLATALAALTTSYWILPPVGSFTIASPVDRLGLVLFTGMGLFMSAVAELYRVNRRKAAAYDQEMALQETRREKEFLANVLEQASQPFAVGYPDGRLGLCNRAYEQLTGYSVEELRAIDWATTLTPPEWRELERQKLEELHRAAQPVRYEKEYVRKDGTRVPIELLVHLVRDAEGKPEYYYSFLTDITKRKEAEAALAQRSALIELSYEPIFVWDMEAGIVDWNHGCEHLYGYSRSEAMGQASHRLLQTEHPCSLDEFEQKLKTNREWTGELQHTTKDGRQVTIASRQQLVERDGRRLVLETNRDITTRKGTEEALASQRKELQVIIESVPAMIFYKDRENHFVRTNKAFEDTMGLPKEKLQGRSLFDLYPKEMAEAFWNDDKVVMASRKSKYGIVEPMQTSHGTRIVQTDKVPYFDESGNVIGVIGFAVDVTERKQAEGALQTNLQRFYSVLSSMYTAVLLVTDEGRVEFANQAFCDQFGLQEAPADLAGLESRDMIERIKNAYLHTDEAVVRILEILDRGQSVKGEELAMQDGRTCLRDFVPLTLHGKSYGRLWLHSDITERKRAEEVLKKAHAELEVRVEERTVELHAASRYARSLLEASLDPLVTISAEGKITDVNDASVQATGVPREKLIGADFSNYFTEPDKAREGYQRVFAEGFVRDYPLAIRHASGRVTDVLYNATVYRNEAGGVQGVFAAARDVTERKRIEAELAQYRDHLEELVKLRTAELAHSNQELEQFAYVASHDLQEPLRAVAGYLGLIESRLRGELDDKSQSHLDGAVQGAARMHALITDLLALSRVGTQGKAFEPTDLNSVLDRALQSVNASVQEAGAKITRDPLPTLCVDAGQMAQLFQNLFGNAVKFRSDRPPEIHVSAQRQADDQWLFAVRDNGIGIEPQYFERIFLIFQRLHTRKEYPGTGIGLAICKKIVERHGGRIWVESQPGQGSTFFFTIPNKGTP